jgi:myo-inositol-1-phosphate synthase
MVQKIRQDIQDMKKKVEKVIVLWTANTEMNLFPEIEKTEDLEARIENNQELPASVLFCYAAIQEGCLYLNGSPQNTFHPAMI